MKIHAFNNTVAATAGSDNALVVFDMLTWASKGGTKPDKVTCYYVAPGEDSVDVPEDIAEILVRSDQARYAPATEETSTKATSAETITESITDPPEGSSPSDSSGGKTPKKKSDATA